MKNRIKNIALIGFIACLYSCTQDDTTLGPSVLDSTTPTKTDLDVWIDNNYVNPYNMEVLYRWDKSAVDNTRYLFPPTQIKVQPALEIVKKIWIDSYSEVGGADFIKKIAPRQLVLIGGYNYDKNGTVTLGIAEAGQRITLFNIDDIDKKNLAKVNQFIHTIQHEYIHILNQTKPFDEKNYAKITPVGYTANWYFFEDLEAREEGFITNYAKSNVIEDFAEMASTMLTSSKLEYEAILSSIENPQAKIQIKAKEALVVKYFKEAYNMDFYRLRDVTETNTTAVVSGK
jgi:substrate import-associated zinc metallohydrolase lipoprotein